MNGFLAVFSNKPLSEENISDALKEDYLSKSRRYSIVALTQNSSKKLSESELNNISEGAKRNLKQNNWLGYYYKGGFEEKLFQKYKEYYIVFKGAIYNEKEILRNLSSLDQIKSPNDAEIFLNTYIEEGVQGLERLRGKWSAVIYNSKEDRIKCFSDAFGQIPLYYLKDGEKIAFSSRIKPLLALQSSEVEPNDQRVIDFLKHGLTDHTEETFFENIYRIKSGQKLEFEDGKISKEIYLEPSSNQPSENMEKAIRRAVERKIPENNFALTVSGGQDSSVVAALTASREPSWYNMSFPDSLEDERQYISLLEEEYGIETKVTEADSEDLFDEIEQSIIEQEEPTNMLPFQAQSLMFKQIDDEVVIQGDGADVLFAGYDKFFSHYIRDLFRKGSFLEVMKALILNRKRVTREFFLDFISLVSPNLFLEKLRTVRGVLERSYVIEPESYSDPNLSRPNSLESAIKEHLDVDWFPTVMRSTEKSAGSRHIEVRAAFLDRDLVASIEKKGFEANFKEGLTKYLLRDAFKQELPKDILLRQNKVGFVDTDDRKYTSNIERQLLKCFNSKNFYAENYVDRVKVIEDLKSGSMPFVFAYRLYNLEIWLEKFS